MFASMTPKNVGVSPSKGANVNGPPELLPLLKSVPRAQADHLLAVLAMAACLASCEAPHASSWSELFEVRPAVGLTEAGVAALVTYTNGSEAYSPAGPLGRVSVSSLRAGTPESVATRQNGSSGFAVTTVSGGEMARTVTFFPAHILDTPYWTGPMRQLGAIGGNRIFVATNLVYPIYIHTSDGILVDSVGQPPPSWRQARRPEIGEFPPSRRAEWHDYLRGITVISGLAVVSNSVLVVTHGRIEPRRTEPDGRGYRTTTTHADIYRSGLLIAVDLPAPGELVAYSNTSLFFLQRSDGSPGGQLTEYVWRHN